MVTGKLDSRLKRRMSEHGIGISTGFIPENERKYQRVCKMHQVDVKYNRHTRNVGIWNNLPKPGERLGMAQEFELVKAMFDLMRYTGVKINRDKNKQSHRVLCCTTQKFCNFSSYD